MFLKDVTVTVTLNTLQSIFITNNVSDVTGFRRIFNPVGLKTADHRRTRKIITNAQCFAEESKLTYLH